jgi:hypothetical protein
VREVARRVKRRQGGVMIIRWTATAGLEAEGHFRFPILYAPPVRLSAETDRLLQKAYSDTGAAQGSVDKIIAVEGLDIRASRRRISH